MGSPTQNAFKNNNKEGGVAKTTAVNHPNYKALETQGSWLSMLSLC